MKNFTEYPGHGGGHENYSMCLTGAKGAKASYNDPRWEAWEAASPSIDHHIAKGLVGKPGVPAVEALGLGVQLERQGSYQAQKRCFYRGDASPTAPTTARTRYSRSCSPEKPWAAIRRFWTNCAPKDAA